MSREPLTKTAIDPDRKPSEKAERQADLSPTLADAVLLERSLSSHENDRSHPLVLDDAESRALYRKLDIRLLPILALLYLLAFMDRGNIGNAKLEGLLTQLQMSSGEYTIALVMFFIPYCVFEPPSNIFLKMFRPSRYIPTLTFVWGTVMTLMGIVKTYPQLVGVRVCLGVAEAGLFPGVVYFLTFWYPREKLQYRVGLFVGAATLAGAFSGLLAYGISFMSGTQGLLGWSWIFILEGIATVTASILAFFVLHGCDDPETASFLRPDERTYVSNRRKLAANGIAEDEHFSRSYVTAALLDWQVLLSTLTYFSDVVGLYGCALFLPSIINGFGYSRAISQLLTVPPFTVATICTIAFGHYSDKLKKRAVFVFAGQCMALIGFIINCTDAPSGVKYFGMFLATSGVYGAFPGIVSWLGSNLAPSYKRGVGMAFQIGIGNFGGVIASVIYREKDKPRYLLGNVIAASFLAAGIVTNGIAVLIYRRINKKRDEQLANGYTETDEDAARLGDRSVTFRYMI